MISSLDPMFLGPSIELEPCPQKLFNGLDAGGRIVADAGARRERRGGGKA
jgi:hypothetical protein